MADQESRNSPKKNPGLLIINADDWGGWSEATDAALACFKRGRITSVSAMVFMEDSSRGAALAREHGIDTGLHINFSDPFTSVECPASLVRDQAKISRFLKRRRSALVLYNPMLRAHFRRVYEAQYAEFLRIYERHPSHVDGHQHMHLSTNMLLDRVVPCGMKMRRSFSFTPGQKSGVNRAYRHLVYHWIKRRYRVPRYFFALSQHLDLSRLAQVLEYAKSEPVELMTHPELAVEQDLLMSEEFSQLLHTLPLGPYASL